MSTKTPVEWADTCGAIMESSSNDMPIPGDGLVKSGNEYPTTSKDGDS